MILFYYIVLILILFLFGLIIIFYIALFYKYLKKEYPCVDKWLSNTNYLGFKWYGLQSLLIFNEERVLEKLSSIEEASIFVEDDRFKKASLLLKMYYISIIVIFILLPIAIVLIQTI